MHIEVNSRFSICEVVIENQNTVIKEDVAFSNKVDTDLINNFFSAGIELSRYNKTSDVETLLAVIYNHLNDHEQEELKQLLK